MALSGLLALGIAWTAGLDGWDDAAITVAHARTLAESGQIGLTPASDPVEGFSSPLFFALMVPLTALASEPAGWMLGAQLAAAVGAVVGFALLGELGRRLGLSPWGAGLAVATLALCSATMREVRNGMENTWTALCLVALLLVRRSWVAALLGAAVVALRPEGIGFVVAVAVGWWAADRKGLAKGALGGAVVAVLAVLAARMALFGEVLPNTLIAKMGPPYQGSGAFWLVKTRVLAGLEPLGVLGVPILVVLGALGARGWRGPVRSADVRAWLPIATLALAGLAIGPIMGRNWGHEGRMMYPAIPAIALILGAAWDRAQIGGRAQAGVLSIALVLQGLLVWRVPSQPLVAAVQPYVETGRWLDGLREDLGRDELTVVVPDVGGTALCCPRLRIVDLGKLAHPRLSHGYEHLSGVLTDDNPDVVVTHGIWSAASGIYDWPGLDAYALLSVPDEVARGRVFLIRRDLADGWRPGPLPTALAGPDAEFVASRSQAYTP